VLYNVNALWTFRGQHANCEHALGLLSAVWEVRYYKLTSVVYGVVVHLQRDGKFTHCEKICNVLCELGVVVWWTLYENKNTKPTVLQTLYV